MTHSTVADRGQESLSRDEKHLFVWKGARLFPCFIPLVVGTGLWILPCPEALSQATWNLFAIFSAMIVGVIARPLPIAPVALFGAIAILMSKTLSFSELFISYSQPGIWMLVMAFFIAEGLIQTKLAIRVAYWFMRILGQNTLGLCYGLILCEVVIAPFIPSLVARSSCIIFPLALASAQNLCKGGEGSPGFKTAGFLMLTTLHGSLISSALFLTSMAGNSLAQSVAVEVGVHITWGQWLLASCVPGILSFFIIPYVIYKIYPPDLKYVPQAREEACRKLQEMGPIRVEEWIMIVVFSLVLSLWLFGSFIGIGMTETCLLGVALLLFTGIITWKNCLETPAAWDTLFWLSLFISIGTHLKQMGFFTWVGFHLLVAVGDLPWQLGFSFVALTYFLSHYFFASNIAHVTAMYFAFLLTSVELGAPPLLATMILAFLSNIMGGLTHYGCAPAPIYFGTGYVSLRKWWQVGAVCGLVNLFLWGVIGSLWMKFVGLY